MKKKLKVLVVEDEVLIAQWLKMELELFGYEVSSVVGSGEESVIKARENKPDIILMDIYLSGDIDGITAAQKIIEHKKIPIIFMTGYSDPKILRKIHEINPIANLYKPISAIDVKNVIESVLK